MKFDLEDSSHIQIEFQFTQTPYSELQEKASITEDSGESAQFEEDYEEVDSNSDSARVHVKKVREGVKVPIPENPGDVGFNLVAKHDAVLHPGESTLIPTGLAFGIPKGYYGQIKPRSGHAKDGLAVDGGVIDQGYMGEVEVILVNCHRMASFGIGAGDRIEQIIFIAALTSPLIEVGKLPTTYGGEEGLGPTGINQVVVKKKITSLENKEEKGQDRHSYGLGNDLDQDQRQKVEDLMKEFEDVLSTSFLELRGTDLKYYHNIDTGDIPPIKQRPYRMPPAYREWARKEIEQMEDSGIIKKSNSPLASPVVIVPKKAEMGLIHRECV